MEVKRLTAQSLVAKLASSSLDLQRQAVCETRLLAKWDMDNRVCIADAGALPLLFKFLSSSDPKIQENAVTALLNLSISPVVRDLIIQSPASLDGILEALKSGQAMETKENSAALLFSLMVEESYRPVVGRKEGLIQALLDLIRRGSPRGKKDAIKALFHIAICHENRPRLVAAGVVPVLVSLLLQSKSGLLEDALAVLAQVAGCVESVDAIRKVNAIPIMVDLLDTGSPRAQENAASGLLYLCQSGGEDVVDDILESNSCLSALSVLLSKGTSRAKNKANSLLQILVVG